MAAATQPAQPASPSALDLKTFGRRSRRFVWGKVSGAKFDSVRPESSTSESAKLHDLFATSNASAQPDQHRRQRSATVSAAATPILPASLDEELRVAAPHKPSPLSKRHGRSRSIFFRRNGSSKGDSAAADQEASPVPRLRLATPHSDATDEPSYGGPASPRSPSVRKAMRDLEQVSDLVCRCAADVSGSIDHEVEGDLYRSRERTRLASMTASTARNSFSTLEESSTCSSPISSYVHDLPVVHGVLLPSSMSRPSRRISAHPSSRRCKEKPAVPNGDSIHTQLDYGREAMNILEAGTAPLGHGSLVAPTPLPPRRPLRCARSRTQSASAASAPNVSSAGFLVDHDAALPPALPQLAALSASVEGDRPQSRGGTKRSLVSTPPHDASETELGTRSRAMEAPHLKQGRTTASTSVGRARSGSASTLANARNVIERTLGGRSRGGSISNEAAPTKTRARSGSNPLSRLIHRTATPTPSEREVDGTAEDDLPAGICTPTFGNADWTLAPLESRAAAASHDDMWPSLDSSEELTEELELANVPRDLVDADDRSARLSLGLDFQSSGLMT